MSRGAENTLNTLKDVWKKLTPEEQEQLGEELSKIVQEEIDREIIRSLGFQHIEDKKDGFI